MKRYEFLLGKLVPFWVLGMVSITLGLLVAFVVYGIVPVGSMLTIYFFSGVYLVGALGVGLLLSTLVDNQLQAGLFSFFITLIPAFAILMFCDCKASTGWRLSFAALGIISFSKGFIMGNIKFCELSNCINDCC